ncbi:MAG TPA: lysophospholipid acyltransferase family protein [Gemmatimonadaceae bacterium]|jgi:1-acyl-sn-glycerol-3-phosphate acyltransferase|nr:lysophospholipid acyltransferase family protein [Gemmatimonadaceae bacterium]
MRSVLTVLTVAVATLILAPLVIIARLLGLGEGVSQWAMRSWARSICAAGGAKLVVHNPENMLRGRGCVYALNHVSWFDVFAIASVLPRYTFIAKSELRKIWLFGWGAEAAGVVFLARENRKAAFESYHGAAAEVARGRSVVVCPEGTRGKEYALRPFKKGPFVLAIAAKAPVVPVVVYGAREVMPKGTFRVRSGTVHIHFLEAVETAGLEYNRRHEVMSQVWDRMATVMREEYGIDSSAKPIAEPEPDGAIAPSAERTA